MWKSTLSLRAVAKHILAIMLKKQIHLTKSTADCIGIYDGPLTQAEVDALYAALTCGELSIPTPTATPRPALGGGLGVIIAGAQTARDNRATAAAGAQQTISPPSTGDAGLAAD